MDIRQEIAARTQQVEKIIGNYLPKEEGYQKTVMEAMNYSFLSGGKRLRPMLLLETYRMFGKTSDIVEPFMAAIEMIHTYSLIHDDLPAMDDDAFRRGRKTTHVVYGEAMAILAGDGLLNYAYETALLALQKDPGNPAAVKALSILASRAGIYGMVGGQTADVEQEGKQLDRPMLDFIYRLKTGALIEAAMLIGAVLAEAGSQEQETILSIARKVGLAFQIQDDILDVAGTMEVLGKPIGSDAKNEKTTYVTLEGIHKAQEDVKSLTQQAVDLLHTLPAKNEFLENLLVYLMSREK